MCQSIPVDSLQRKCIVNSTITGRTWDSDTNVAAVEGFFLELGDYFAITLIFSDFN